MDKIEKIGATAILAALFAWLVAAKYRNEKINSYKSFNGIAKKICMWLLIVVGGVLDWLIVYVAGNVGIDLGISVIVAIIVCAWLMCNEIISILENMIDIGVQMPAFLMKITKHIQSKVEESSDIEEDDENGY